MTDYDFEIDTTRTIVSLNEFDLSTYDYDLNFDTAKVSISLKYMLLSQQDFEFEIDTTRIIITLSPITLSKADAKKDKSRILSFAISGCADALANSTIIVTIDDVIALSLYEGVDFPAGSDADTIALAIVDQLDGFNLNAVLPGAGSVQAWYDGHNIKVKMFQ